jgi:uncharacterized protein YndB with AHSA1/START domain
VCDLSITVKSEQMVKVSPDQVYYAFTHAIVLHEWLCDFATVAPRPGGRMYLWWHGDFFSAGEYISLEENKSIKFKWFGRGEPAPTEVTVTLKKVTNGTRVILEHVVPDGDVWLEISRGFKAEWDSTLANLAQLLETGRDQRTADRPLLGINIDDFTPEQAQVLGVPVSQGIHLADVVPGLGAHAAGLQKDDVIIELNGHPVTNDFGSLLSRLQGKKGGDQVEVVYYHGPVKKTVMMELTKRPIPDIPWEPAELAKRVRSIYDNALARLDTCFTGVNEEEADYEPAPGEWSAKQVLGHLIQTERGWIPNLDDAIGGYERLADDWGGNLPSHINATVKAYGTIKAMLDELRQLSVEMVTFIELIPSSFVERKACYYTNAVQLLDLENHTLMHLDQINAAIEMARKR